MEPMSNLLELRETIKVGSKALDVASIEELACLEKVRIAFLPLSFLHNIFFPVFTLKATYNLAITIIDKDVCFP